MNPHQTETHYAYDLEEKFYKGGKWYDSGVWVEVKGPSLVICTISISQVNSANFGFRLVDENDEPLLPYRTPTNSRRVVHFSAEPHDITSEEVVPLTFHMIANCKHVRLQYFPDDNLGTSYPGYLQVNHSYYRTDAAWNHKPLSTISVLPLTPNYRGGANTTFTYPQPRTLIGDEKDKLLKRKSPKPLKKDRS